MAAFFIREIKSIQPCGPYKLMGYSWGGHLVYAMACLLHASGEEVAFLGLLDTRTFRISKIKIFIQNSRNNLHSLRKLSLLRWPEYFYPKIYQYIFRRIRPSLPQKGIYIQTTEQILFSRNKTAVDMYHYKKYSGPVFLFKTETDRPVWYQWEKYCKHLVVCNIPGNHLSIMAGPEIPLLAKAINQEINKTEDKDI